MADLAGRVALITGAASGIGRASALAFASAGASVALVDVDADGLAETAAARKARSRAEVLAADVTNLEAVTAAVGGAVPVFGRLDAAHNNAGVPGPYVPLDEYSEEDFLRVLQVDLAGVWRCMRDPDRHDVSGQRRVAPRGAAGPHRRAGGDRRGRGVAVLAGGLVHHRVRAGRGRRLARRVSAGGGYSRPRSRALITASSRDSAPSLR